MARPSIREYQIKRANAPNGDKVWHIVGRPNGKRIRAWFKTKEAAQAEATVNWSRESWLGSIVVCEPAKYQRATSNP